MTTSPPVDEPACYSVTIDPDRSNGRTIILTHGAYHNAQHYLKTFDGRPGWAYDFAAAGYRVVLADYPGTGASPKVADPSVINHAYICRGFGRLIDTIDGPIDLLVHSMSGTIGLSLLENHNDRIEHLVMIAASGPAELEIPPSVVEDLGDTVRAVYGDRERIFTKGSWTEGDEEFVLRCIGNGTRFPSVDLEVYRASLSPLWAGLSIDTAYRLFDPPLRSVDFGGRAVLVMAGTHDANHPREREQRLTDWLRDHGAKADLLYLGDVGIDGNAHMLMLEENSAELAGLAVDWLAASTV